MTDVSTFALAAMSADVMSRAPSLVPGTATAVVAEASPAASVTRLQTGLALTAAWLAPAPRSVPTTATAVAVRTSFTKDSRGTRTGWVSGAGRGGSTAGSTTEEPKR